LPLEIASMSVSQPQRRLMTFVAWCVVVLAMTEPILPGALKSVWLLAIFVGLVAAVHSQHVAVSD
jgi:hypothetical protein